MNNTSMKMLVFNTAIMIKMFSVTLIMAIFGFITAENITCDKMSYENHVQNVTFLRTRINLVSATDKLIVRYKISLKQTPCCALIRFETDRTIDELHGDPNQECFGKGIRKIVLSSQYYIFLSHGNPTSGCKRTGSRYVCMGTRMFHIGNRSHWYMSAGYECGINQSLDISISMEFECDYPTRCERIEHPYCKKELNYGMTTFPNTLGQLSQARADLFLQALVLVMDEVLECYQNVKEFICFSIFPKCVNDKRVIPCLKMCQEVKIACAHLLRKYNQPLYCGIYPDSSGPDECFYEPITCPVPRGPEFGHVEYSGIQVFDVCKYTCKSAYDILGTSERRCMYNGKWNGIEPVCIPRHTIDIKIMIISVISMALIMIIILLCVYYKKDIFLILMFNRHSMKRLYQVTQTRGSLFLTYSSEDKEFVEDQFLSVMKFELPSLNILTYQENFVGGEKLLDSIHKGIWESTAVAVLLTKKYISSCWCRYEFSEGQTRSITDRNFKFIIILPQENTDRNVLQSFLEEMPENIRLWVKSRVCLRVGERLFWNKLRRSLGKCA